MSILSVRKRPEVPYLLAKLSGFWGNYRFSFSLVSGDGTVSDLAYGRLRVPRRFFSDDFLIGYMIRRGPLLEGAEELRDSVHVAKTKMLEALDALGYEAADYPLTVFAQAETGVGVEGWWRVTRTFFSTALEDDRQRPPLSIRQLEVVLCPMRRANPLGPLERSFQLPVNVVAPPDLTDALLDAERFLRDVDVGEHVLSLRAREDGSPDPSGTDLRIRRFDSPSKAYEWLGNKSSEVRVRVALVHGWKSLPRSFDLFAPWGPDWYGPALPIRLVEGTACIVVPLWADDLEAERRFLRAFMRELVHDRPLSTVLALARRELHDDRGFANFNAPYEDSQRAVVARLYTDPSTNNWLRFSRALDVVEQGAQKLRHFADSPQFERLADELMERGGRSDAVSRFAQALRAAGNAASPSMAVLRTGIEFSGESTGVQPMARVLQASRSAAIDSFHSELTALSGNHVLLDALEEAQQRRVDAELKVRDEGGVLRSTKHGLVSGTDVRLTVRIGQRSPDSIVDDDVPAIDPMLPELAANEMHEVDIVVFPKDFSLKDSTPACQTVQLPRFGGTMLASWDLAAPVLGEHTENGGAGADSALTPRPLQDGDEAELRFNIYFRNQLLQSFALTSTIHQERAWRGRSRVRCDFSQTSRFGRLESFAERHATLALNKGRDGTHLLSLRDSRRKASSVQWHGGSLDKRLMAARRELLEALEPNGTSPFAFNTETLACEPQDVEAFAIAVRRLAKAGASLCNQLALMSSAEVVDIFEAVQESSNKTIQVVLLDPTYSLPWGLLYDYRLDEDALETMPVCKGLGDSGQPCQCQPEAGTTICLRGFWGFRHRIEQLCGGHDSNPTEAKVIADQPTSPPIAFMQGIDDVFTGRLEKALRVATPALQHVATPSRFLQHYGNAASRPSVIVIVAHLEQADLDDAATARLVNADNSTLLSVNELGSEYRSRKRHWAQPRSLVLLMACGSGQQSPGTGVGLSGALVRLRATGVLGTECAVYTGIASRIAKDVLERLHRPSSEDGAKRMSVGDALREAIWGLALEGCPLGLAFTYIGSLDATLP